MTHTRLDGPFAIAGCWHHPPCPTPGDCAADEEWKRDGWAMCTPSCASLRANESHACVVRRGGVQNPLGGTGWSVRQARARVYTPPPRCGADGRVLLPSSQRPSSARVRTALASFLAASGRQFAATLRRVCDAQQHTTALCCLHAKS